MHVRRALLLFAIVLVVAALAASISSPPREREEQRPAEPPAGDRQAGSGRDSGARGQRTIAFSTRGGPRTLALETGSPARVAVAVEEPGQVELEGLGRTAAAVPGTPAGFDVLATSPGRHAVLFEPAANDERERVGTLVIGSRAPAR